MTAAQFPACLALTIGYERGYSNHPRDPGGSTLDGITQAVYDDDRDQRNLPMQDVRQSTAAEREAIYRRRYWDKAGCNDLPTGVDYAVFDFAVNSGVARAVKTLQMTVAVPADGVMGPATLAAVSRYCAMHGAGELTDELCQQRMRFLQSLRTYATFGNGWKRRVMGERDGAQPGDTGVIDRAFDMTRNAPVTAPKMVQVVPKTYLARATSCAGSP